MTEMNFGPLVISLIVGFVSGGVGMLVGLAVTKEQVKAMLKVQDAHTEALKALPTLVAEVAGHTRTLARVVYADKCKACDELEAERRKNDNERYSRLEVQLTKLHDQFDALSKQIRDLFPMKAAV
jgi:chaperonin cofactor prefoldin